MINHTTIEMSEEEHGLVGCGRITFTYLNEGTIYKGYYTFIDQDYVIEISSDKAKTIFERLVMEEKIDINIILLFATDSCEIPLFRIKEKSRKVEVVFARYLVFWYVKNYLNFTLEKAGNLFDKDHATVLYGVKIIDENPKYLKYDQQRWRKTFMKKLREKDLI